MALINVMETNKSIKNKFNIIPIKENGKALYRIEDKKGKVITFCEKGSLLRALKTYKFT